MVTDNHVTMTETQPDKTLPRDKDAHPPTTDGGATKSVASGTQKKK